MCGIVGYISDHDIVPQLLKSLKLLEYRGYDSSGIAVVNGSLKVEKTVGWRPSCACVDESDHNGPFEPVPQTVLDPFNGSGTTGAVAVMHGRSYIGIELNPDYIGLSQRRIGNVQMEAAL